MSFISTDTNEFIIPPPTQFLMFTAPYLLVALLPGEFPS